jgi:ubiquitin-conjugating enzyme E2 T
MSTINSYMSLSLASQQASAPLSIPAKARLSRELSRLQQDPPPGIAAFLETDDNLSVWHAEIVGPPNSPFQDGVFELVMKFPPRYPMEPPNCRFTSNPAPYHPNIDSSGRICLDTLKSPPSGTWSPAVSLSSLLLSLRSLLAEPNSDDGLVADISQQYRLHPEQWRAEAKRQTQLLMMKNTSSCCTQKRALDKAEKEETNLGVEQKRLKQSPSE